MTQNEALQEILKRLEELNKDLKESPIPTSEDFRKRHVSDLVANNDELFFYLRQLEDSHYIFVITIVEPNATTAVPGIYGYVIAKVEIDDCVFSSKIPTLFGLPDVGGFRLAFGFRLSASKN